MELKFDKSHFLDENGRIKELPQKHKTRVAVLEYLSEKFEPGRDYTEQEVNAVCSQWHTFGDYFLLRRELVDNGLLCRERNGSRYWVAKPDDTEEKATCSVNSKFHPIDFENWDRKQYFYYFTKMLPTGFSLTVDIDITETYLQMKKENKKFFPAYLYLSSKLITEQQEFRIAKREDQVGYYEVLHPSYACFHEDDKTMSNLWTEYNSSFRSFYQNYIDDQTRYGSNHGVLAKPVSPPENSFLIGMLPWTQFTSYSPVPYGGASSLFPVLQAGKFFFKNERKMMPLSITVHHATADGYHVGLFLNQFQEGMNHPESWMN